MAGSLVPFPRQGKRRSPSPMGALAYALSELHDDADAMTCVAGALLMTDRLHDMGFEVVRRVGLPLIPLTPTSPPQ